MLIKLAPSAGRTVALSWRPALAVPPPSPVRMRAPWRLLARAGATLVLAGALVLLVTLVLPDNGGEERETTAEQPPSGQAREGVVREGVVREGCGQGGMVGGVREGW